MNQPSADFRAALEGRYRVERPLGEGGMATVDLGAIRDQRAPTVSQVLTNICDTGPVVGT